MIDAQSYEELGRKLRHIRLDHKVSLEQAAMTMHVRPRYLDALEDGLLDQLPGDPYVQGYYRRYARMLGLSEEEVVEAYRRIGALPQRRMFYIPESIRREQHPAVPLVAVTLVLAFGLAAWWIVANAPSRPALMVQQMAPEDIAPAFGAAEEAEGPACIHAARMAWPPCYWEEMPSAQSKVIWSQALGPMAELLP